MKGFVPIKLLVLFMALLVLVGVYFTLSSRLDEDMQDTSTSNSETPSDREVFEDWREYKSERLGIRFEYPIYLAFLYPVIGFVAVYSAFHSLGCSLTNCHQWKGRKLITNEKRRNRKIKSEELILEEHFEESIQ